jgi:hypothetical protein
LLTTSKLSAVDHSALSAKHCISRHSISVVGPADVVALAVHVMTNMNLTGATYDIDGGQQLVGI